MIVVYLDVVQVAWHHSSLCLGNGHHVGHQNVSIIYTKTLTDPLNENSISEVSANQPQTLSI